MRSLLPRLCGIFLSTLWFMLIGLSSSTTTEESNRNGPNGGHTTSAFDSDANQIEILSLIQRLKAGIASLEASLNGARNHSSDHASSCVDDDATWRTFKTSTIKITREMQKAVNRCRMRKLMSRGSDGEGGEDGNRILRGKKVADTKSVPYIVGLRRYKNDHLFCGGSIIHPMWILTAAHCVQKYQTNPKWIRITAGNVYREKKSRHEQERDVDQIIVHEKYEPDFTDEGYDIALLKLNQSLVFNDRVNRILLPAGITQWEGSSRVSGWGKLEFRGNSSSDQLMRVEIPIVPQANCSSEYEKYEYDITSSMICAGGNGKDSCTGDSGGPLTCENDTVLCGVVSFGKGCGVLPGVYTDVSHYIKWIRSRIRPVNPERKCGSEYFYCKEDHRCISRKLLCDRKKDCSGGSDEDTCVQYETDVEARETYFLCTNGQPVSNSVCGGNDADNCEDKSDELKCDFKGKNGSCWASQFSCVTDGRCVDGSWRDDGVEDCDDGSDEQATYKPLPLNLTQVLNGCRETDPSHFTKGYSIFNNRDYFLCEGSSSPPFNCIPNWWVCDGRNHCSNGRDEDGCASTIKNYKTFQCRNGGRIPRSKRCDGSSDCADASDEINCRRLDSYAHSFQLPYLL